MSTYDCDLVLINPSSRKRVYQSLANELAAIEPPVWAGLMATFVRGKGHSVRIIDGEGEELSHDEVAQRVKDYKPRVAAIVAYGHQPSASTQIMPAVSAACSAIKQLAPDQLVILVGGHVAALPERTLREESADFVSAGEGLYTLIDLIEAHRAGQNEWNKVRDLVRRDGDAILTGPRAPLMMNVNEEMPGIAWDLLPMNRYRAHNWHCMGEVGSHGDLERSPYVAIYTTLGCPYKCSFCCIQAPFKRGESELGMKQQVNSYRFWNPVKVVDDLQMLTEKYGVRNVKFADEMFVLTRRHVEGICDEIIRRKLDLNIWAYARVDTVKEGMLPKLKQAGFNWLAFGIEAANARVRQDVQKGFDQDDIFRTLRQVWDHGIHVIGNYIFGLPEDNYDTMQETLDMAVELNCEFGNFYCAMAYPGSPLYQQAIANNWALPDNWGGYSQHSVDSLPLRTRYLSAGEVLKFRDQAFQFYYRNPRYLEMVERKFGPATVEHIRHMTGFKLERKNINA